ncbi:MAG: serine hydrolase, partial [Gammaproteobacteria bacterium]|nr:serine hydrolase [Gammaproteobacteria bacterium]
MPRLLTVIAVCFLASCSEPLDKQSSIESQHEQSTLDPAMATTRELPHASPEEVGMSAEGLQKIDDVVQEYIGAGRIRGAVVGVTRRNKVVYMEALGALDDTTERPMRKDAMFHMASSTKPVLGVAAMMM